MSYAQKVFDNNDLMREIFLIIQKDAVLVIRL